MIIKSSQTSFSRTRLSRMNPLRRLSLVLLGVTAAAGMGVLRVQSAIAVPNSSTPAETTELLAQATTTTSNAEQATALLQNYYQAINARDYARPTPIGSIRGRPAASLLQNSARAMPIQALLELK